MRVVYKKSVADQIMEVVSRAKAHGKRVDYVMVTDEEWDELRCETSYNNHISWPPHDRAHIRTITLENPEWHRRGGARYVRFPILDDVTLGGVSLVRVPALYHGWRVAE